MPASPNIENYAIGKGKIAVSLDDGANWRHVGNVTTFAFTPELEKLEHFSSMTGVKTRDRTVIISKKGTLKMTMEEWTAANLALALLGVVEANTAGNDEFGIFTENAVHCQVKFIGTNEIGPRYQVVFPAVDIIPSGEINFLSDEWGAIEVEGEVAAVGERFGTVTKIADEGELPTEEPTF